MNPVACGVRFPSDELPADSDTARLLGLYPQRQEGRWMQRIKVLGGRLTGPQWRGLARTARELTPSAPLHLTTRQDVELHDVAPARVPAVQRRIAALGLTCVGACGDTLRNVTVCPCSGAVDGSAVLQPLATMIRRKVEGLEGIFALPRKFKIALSCGEACGQPWLNDLGLVAKPRDGRWGFFVVAGGSLGAKPATGTVLFDWLPAGDVLPLACAAVKVFAAHGDRTNRFRARLRHVRQRVGDAAFRQMLTEALRQAKAERSWPEVAIDQAAGGFEGRLTLTFANGDVAPEAAEALAELADRPDVRARIANHHRVVLFGRSEQDLRRLADPCEALAESARPQPAVVACPGKRWCARALTHAQRLADRLRAEVPDLPPGATVCISGCPNGCAHSAVADVGLTGRLASDGGTKPEAYDLFVGGGMGRSDTLAAPAARRLSPDDAVHAVRRLLDPTEPSRPARP
jgi:sulfite reductase (ferredoxin)